jgi:hypothetical protein
VAAGISLRREHVIAALLVGGVVVIVGFASGLGLHTNTTNAQAAAPGQSQSPVNPGMPVSPLPQALQPPPMSMPGGDLSATQPVVVDQPVPGGAATAPAVPAAPITPAAPGIPVTQPTQPTTPGPPTPSACLPGAAQQVVDTANGVVAGLPVVSTLTGTLGLTQSPDGSSPGALNTLLYTVTGYCAPAEPAAPAAPVTALTSALPALVPAKVGG